MPTLATISTLDQDGVTAVVFTPTERSGNKVLWVNKAKEANVRPRINFDYIPASSKRNTHKYVIDCSWPIPGVGGLPPNGDVARMNTTVLVPVSMSDAERKSFASQFGLLLASTSRIPRVAIAELEGVL